LVCSDGRGFLPPTKGLFGTAKFLEETFGWEASGAPRRWRDRQGAYVPHLVSHPYRGGGGLRSERWAWLTVYGSAELERAARELFGYVTPASNPELFVQLWMFHLRTIAWVEPGGSLAARIEVREPKGLEALDADPALSCPPADLEATHPLVWAYEWSAAHGQADHPCEAGVNGDGLLLNEFVLNSMVDSLRVAMVASLARRFG